MNTFSGSEKNPASQLDPLILSETETILRNAPVGSTGNENPTGTFLGNVSCMTTQN